LRNDSKWYEDEMQNRKLCRARSLARTFTIARGARQQAQVVVVEIRQDTHIGRGECVPYARYQESTDSVIAAITAMRECIAAGGDRTAINARMPAGAARNAIDCALWDLEAKLSRQSLWQSLAIDVSAPVVTADTIGLVDLNTMQQAARDAVQQGMKLLKVKLDDQQVVAKIAAIRASAPTLDIIIDANEAWTCENLVKYSAALRPYNISMIQPEFGSQAYCDRLLYCILTFFLNFSPSPYG